MPDAYRVIVTGDRNWRIDELAITVVRGLKKKHPGLVVVHGGCSGVDDSFAAACRVEGVVDAPANLPGKDEKSMRIRNEAMVDAGASLCLAFHRFLPNSKGTRDCVSRALKAGIETWHADSETAKPKRLHYEAWFGLRDKRWGPAKGDDTPGVDMAVSDPSRRREAIESIATDAEAIEERAAIQAEARA